jgi:hypothetical protein
LFRLGGGKREGASVTLECLITKFKVKPAFLVEFTKRTSLLHNLIILKRNIAIGDVVEKEMYFV